MKNFLKLSSLFIFLLNITKFYSLNTKIGLSPINSNNNTSPVFLGPPVSSQGSAETGARRSHGNLSNTNNNSFIPSQPGTPAAFFPVPLLPAGTNVTSGRVGQPRNVGTANRTVSSTSETNAYLPAQPGIPGAFIPQPLTGARSVNNTAAGIIPAEFWVNQNGTDYIILKNRLDGYFICDDGNLTTLSNLTNTNTTNTNFLWIPSTVRANTVTLRSSNGGYLYLSNSLFYCNGTTNDLNSQFQVRVGLKNDRMRSTDYIAFRIDIGYLGLRDNIVMLIQQLDERAMFDPIGNPESTPSFR